MILKADPLAARQAYFTTLLNIRLGLHALTLATLSMADQDVSKEVEEQMVRACTDLTATIALYRAQAGGSEDASRVQGVLGKAQTTQPRK